MAGRIRPQQQFTCHAASSGIPLPLINPFSMLTLAAGLVCLAVSIFNPAVCYEHPRVAILVDLLGRIGTRIFYLLAGLGLLYYGYPPA